jgi:hypothetical protein
LLPLRFRPRLRQGPLLLRKRRGGALHAGLVLLVQLLELAISPLELASSHLELAPMLFRHTLGSTLGLRLLLFEGLGMLLLCVGEPARHLHLELGPNGRLRLVHAPRPLTRRLSHSRA